MSVIPVPPAQSDPVDHANWVELEAIGSQDGACSLQTLASQLRISGTTEALTDEGEDDPHDAGGEQSYVVASDAWAEVERRFTNCGEDDGSYPFHVTQSSIELKDDWQQSVYVFQVLLSQFGKDAVPGEKPERLFEKISALAASNYLGGDSNVVERRCFGSPRDDGTNFIDALSTLCRDMNDGCVRTDDPKVRQQKDGKLDVVVWRPFRDRRRGQLVAFGQCATNKKLDVSKLRELDPQIFRDSWLGADGIHPVPIRMFFAPHCVHDSEWRTTTINGGIIFDRCRIAELVRVPGTHLAQQCADWSESVAQSLRGRT